MIIPIGDENPTQRFPLVHYIFIGVNCLVFVLINFRSDFSYIVRDFGFTPSKNEFGTLFTSMFMHGDIFHILGNMLFLWIFGDNVEDTLGWLYAPFYLLCGLSATMMHYVTDPASAVPCIGASGAISGVLGFYLVFFPWHKVKFLYFFRYYRAGTFYLEAFWAIGFWFVLQLIMGFLSSAYKLSGGIAYWAHIGGFTFGFVAAVCWRFLVMSESKKITPQVKSTAPSGRNVEPDSILQSLSSPGNEDEFISTYTKYTRLYGDTRIGANNHLHAGEILLDKKAFKETAKAYTTFLLLYPDHKQSQQARYYLAELLIHKLNQSGKGREYLRQLLSKPGPDEALVNYARQELDQLETQYHKITSGKKPEELSGNCMVIRQSDEEINATILAETVAKITGQQRFDVIRQISFSHGIIAKQLMPEQAKALAEYLSAQDIPAMVLDESQIMSLPAVTIVLNAELNGNELILSSAIGKKMIYLSDIYLSVAGRIVFKKRELVKELPGHTPEPVDFFVSPLLWSPQHTSTREPDFDYKDMPANEFVIEIITKDLGLKYLFSSERTFVKGFKDEHQFTSRLRGISLLAKELLKTETASSAEALSLLASENYKNDDWLRFTFQSQFNMDEYILWLVHLKSYK